MLLAAGACSEIRVDLSWRPNGETAYSACPARLDVGEVFEVRVEPGGVCDKQAATCELSEVDWWIIGDLVFVVDGEVQLDAVGEPIRELAGGEDGVVSVRVEGADTGYVGVLGGVVMNGLEDDVYERGTRCEINPP